MSGVILAVCSESRDGVIERLHVGCLARCVELHHQAPFMGGQLLEGGDAGRAFSLLKSTTQVDRWKIDCLQSRSLPVSLRGVKTTDQWGGGAWQQIPTYYSQIRSYYSYMSCRSMGLELDFEQDEPPQTPQADFNCTKATPSDKWTRLSLKAARANREFENTLFCTDVTIDCCKTEAVRNAFLQHNKHGQTLWPFAQRNSKPQIRRPLCVRGDVR